MSTYRLENLFAPRSVALVGASAQQGSLGHAVLANLRAAGFGGELHLVNPGHAEIDGLPCVPSLTAIGKPVDVVVIATPKAVVPAIVEEAGALGCCTAIIITAGFDRGPGSAEEQMTRSARKHGLRLVGPNCLGVIAPRANFDASFAATPARPGDLALISQSGAIATALLDWAQQHSVGFSGVVSLGDKIDVDFGDCLDYFAQDRATRAILLYVESINDPRKFMSAARAAARTKPVVVVKSGRHSAGARAAQSHTGALAGADAVYDAAFRRAGLLRVYDLDELFAAVETLSRVAPFPGDRVAVLTNGGGLGVLAVDRLSDLGGRLAQLSPATVEALRAVLPAAASLSNPVDVVGDADAARYGAAMNALLQDDGIDAVLVMNCPTALVSSVEGAQAIADAVKTHRGKSFRPKPVFAVWMGDTDKTAPIFEAARIPSFATEADAVRGIMHLVAYRKAQDLLMEMPPSLPADFQPDVETARARVRDTIAKGMRWLDPVSVTDVLEAYGVPVAPVRAAATPEEAGRIAEGFLGQGQAVAIKILSQQITHKSDVGGVVLNLSSREAVVSAAATMMAKVTQLRPDAVIDGVTVQPMIHRPRGRELIAGLADDPTFGPVVVFGRGGTAVEVINDKTLALPPLDMTLARTMMSRTRVYRLLEGYRDVPPADLDAVALTLVKLAQLSADIPEIRELDLNPLISDETGCIALDARIAVEAVPLTTRREACNPRFAIKPYPKEWERELTLKGGWKVDVRPVRPEDEPLYVEFFKHVTPNDLRLRFFAKVKEFSHAFIARLIQIDYSRAIAFAALDKETGELMGVVRLHADANHETGEYAILLRSDLKGRGLGWALMQLMIDFARADGIKTVEGQILRENTTMLAMCEALGFEAHTDRDDNDIKIVRLDLGDKNAAAVA
ncbi:bifunctional acetate--CoA ligase family protein/GNAT family N-acetyltransferase [Alsobacter sp. SYSU M60028]|uniref:Bifunctional acetate--CoA ligase family protein/GNAT family N-acetyltransferase n=1 Tax=Alsobacter ponti TaxID=2962936 RepID=A0ABT1LDI1_9HYPH|nr:bifunctional acetate--CoA ligase family protein/GNAT family N-acetyltransferase [Alsobacter ponti]MCP8939148.1 bifunctional acetate--CoA ligase family protein/GNAT family N-acetyltransferase [Alsobacter ponti]